MKKGRDSERGVPKISREKAGAEPAAGLGGEPDAFSCKLQGRAGARAAKDSKMKPRLKVQVPDV